MHIPDGYLSPGTAGILYGAVLPFWYIAGRKLRRFLSMRTVPLMALISAFCFIIQMINIPLPGGTTGHAVGSGLAGIVLGPWPAIIAVSIALVIQALFFADGGITTIGANCFNMAVAEIFVTWFLYRMFARKGAGPRHLAFAAAIASYIGVNVAALLTGMELGLQPWIAHAADGTPLYAPYPMSVSVPSMLIGHLIAGFAEAAIAGAAVYYLHKSAPELLAVLSRNDQAIAGSNVWKRLRTVWVVVGGLVLITPIGLLAPGTAWGEWASSQFRGLGLGFVPEGVQRWEGLWKGVFHDYSIPGIGQNTGYVLSAAIGVLLIVLVFAGLTILARKGIRRQKI